MISCNMQKCVLPKHILATGLCTYRGEEVKEGKEKKVLRCGHEYIVFIKGVFMKIAHNRINRHRPLPLMSTMK